MKKSMSLCLMAMILTWVSAENSHLPSSYDQQEKKNQSSSSQAAFQLIQGNDGNARMKEERRRNEEAEEAYYSRVSRVGSSPPNCKHKCRGCNPCHPIQIPTTTDTLPLRYANYEPEGWKCKCGPSFFNP